MNAVHADDRESLRSSIASVTPEKPDFVHEHRACWRDGTVHWISVRGRGFFDQQGRLLKISGIAMDIDERKRAEERLRLLAAALEEAPNAVVLTDPQGAILWVNPAFSQMTGYSAEEAIGKDPRLWRPTSRMPRSMWPCGRPSPQEPSGAGKSSTARKMAASTPRK